MRNVKEGRKIRLGVRSLPVSLRFRQAYFGRFGCRRYKSFMDSYQETNLYIVVIGTVATYIFARIGNEILK